nr:reverse transcriptase domain-containing protein [Tanacetum cinerariifolium]
LARVLRKELPSAFTNHSRKSTPREEEGTSRKGLDLDVSAACSEALKQDATVPSHQGKKIGMKNGVQKAREGCIPQAQRQGEQEIEFAFEKRHNKRASSRRIEALSESKGSVGRHWKSKPKRQKSSIEDDMSQPWKSFLENYLQQKKRIKDPVEIHNIKQRDVKSTKEFVQRYKLECMDVKGAPECMKILGFMHRITNPELIKRLQDKILKSVDEMMRVTTTFLRGGQKQNFKKGGFRNQQRSERKQDRFTLLTKTPREILALDKGKFKPPSPMTTPVEKRNASKFCEFHWEVGHNTNECMHLKRQIEEMLKAEKLSHLIKEIKQSNGKDQEKAAKKGKPQARTSHWQSLWYRKGSQTKDYPNLLSKNSDFIPTPGGGGWDRRFCLEVKSQMVPITTPLVGFSREIIWPLGKISLLVKIGETVTLQSSRIIPLECTMVSGPGAQQPIIDQAMEEKFRQKKRRQAPERNKEIYEEVEKVVNDNIMKEFHYPSRLSNPVMTAKAETTFKQTKKSIAEFPMLTAPKKKEELIIYLATAKEAISVVLMMKRDGKQMPIYFGNRITRSKNQLHSNGEDDTCSDFIMEHLENDSSDTPMEEEKELLDPWILFTNGSLCIDGSGADIILTNPRGMEFTYALRFRFDATNNKAEYKALIAGLRIAKQMGVENLQTNVDSWLEANQVNETYIVKEQGMIKYLEKVRTLTSTFRKFSIKQVPRGENKKADALSKIVSTSFAHLSKQVLVEELKEKSIDKKEVLALVEEEGRIWIVGPLTSIDLYPLTSIRG